MMCNKYSRSKPLGVIVSLDEKQSASGDFYWDDGDTIIDFDNPDAQGYFYARFKFENQVCISLSRKFFFFTIPLKISFLSHGTTEKNLYYKLFEPLFNYEIIKYSLIYL